MRRPDIDGPAASGWRAVLRGAPPWHLLSWYVNGKAPHLAFYDWWLVSLYVESEGRFNLALRRVDPDGIPPDVDGGEQPALAPRPFSRYDFDARAADATRVTRALVDAICAGLVNPDQHYVIGDRIERLANDYRRGRL